ALLGLPVGAFLGSGRISFAPMDRAIALAKAGGLDAKDSVSLAAWLDQPVDLEVSVASAIRSFSRGARRGRPREGRFSRVLFSPRYRTMLLPRSRLVEAIRAITVEVAPALEALVGSKLRVHTGRYLLWLN